MAARCKVDFSDFSKAKVLTSIIVHCVCLSVLLYITLTSIQRYFKFDTKALMDVRDTKHEKDFVAVTICPAIADALKSEVLEKYCVMNLFGRYGLFQKPD